jgi:putative endonuclease
MNLVARISDWVRHTVQRRRMTPERALARRGEDLAHRYLERRGYQVVARNYRTPAGGNEVDLIAWHQGHLVFVEVKTRSHDDVAQPERAVTPEKRRRIIRAATDYARRTRADWGTVRFDVVAVVALRPPSIRLYPDAFGVTSQL